MDAGAFLKIEDLNHILTENNIEISRLRGLRLMKEEEKVSEEKINEIIKLRKIELTVTWLRQHCWWCWSSSKDRKKHKAFIYGYTELEDWNGQPYKEKVIVDIDFSKIHGKDRKILKYEYKKAEKEIRNAFGMFNKYVGKNVLYVHARQGGGNRLDYPIDTKHPMYLEDIDDWCDNTYCDIYYDLTKKRGK